MGWLDTDSNFVSVPQGSEFFYPADYVEFLDSLYTRSKDGGTSADVSNIVVASELTPFTNTDTQLQNAIGGTLRQCLCVKESLDFGNTAFVDLGTLTWSYSNSVGHLYFSATISDIKIATSGSTPAKIITTKLKTSTGNVVYNNTEDNTICVSASDHTVLVYCSSYTSADTFKNAMKCVLLAYEKA